MLVLDGHESHHSFEFETYCKDNNIITLCLPPHSSHLTQPLDVGLFSPLKRAYGDQINLFIRTHINHITKDEFLVAYHAAYNTAITKENIAGGFRGAGLIPYNPEAVISKLDVKLRTPEESRPGSANADTWVSTTPKNPLEAVCQSTLVRDQITRHQGSSPTKIFEAAEQMARGMVTIAHELTLVRKRVRDLETANEALSKRRRAKRTQIQKGGSLTVAEAQDLIARTEAEMAAADERFQNGQNGRGGSGTIRRCSKCSEPGHTARTCQV
jgi:hypothetical protein